MHRSVLRAAIAMAATVSLSAPAYAVGIYIITEDKVPTWNQIHDYRDTYDNRLTNIVAPGGGSYLNYSQLAADARTFFPRGGTVMMPGGRRPLVFVNPANPRDKFNANDYYDAANAGWNLAGGGWHCAPTSTAMYVEWARQTILTRLDNRGGEVKSIDDFAKAADTNDYDYNISNTDNQLHFGTYRGPMIDAANKYADDSSILYDNKTFRAWNYTANGYRQIINRGNAMVLYYSNIDPVTMQANGGHVVVGVGYDDATNEAILRDPWEGRGDQRKNFNNIQQLGGGGGGGEIAYGAAPHSLTSDDANWVGARMNLFEVPDYGDAPSPYLSGPMKTAFNRSGLREWLGASISGEIDPLQAQDDQDGVANVNNNDSDDGILFGTPFDRGQLASGSAILSSISDMSVDTEFNTETAPTLYLQAWIDWNLDTTWSPDELMVALTLGADFMGSINLNFSFLVPQVPDGEYWARFRLTRGETPGPYGEALFGEIEDYQITVIPEPSAAALLLLSPLTLLRRPRH